MIGMPGSSVGTASGVRSDSFSRFTTSPVVAKRKPRFGLRGRGETPFKLIDVQSTGLTTWMGPSLSNSLRSSSLDETFRQSRMKSFEYSDGTHSMVVVFSVFSTFSFNPKSGSPGFVTVNR